MHIDIINENHFKVQRSKDSVLFDIFVHTDNITIMPSKGYDLTTIKDNADIIVWQKIK